MMALFLFISTHSAREDGDYMFDINIPACFVISTHSAREDGDCIYYAS